MSVETPPHVTIARYGTEGARALSREVLAIYDAAWAETPFAPSPAQLLDFEAVLERHFDRPTFRLVLARTHDGATAGFAYGYTSTPGGWWRDVVATALDPVLVEEWFSDCFEFVELAVDPRMQGAGVGARLHDALLEGLTHRTSVLSTQTENGRARRLYERKGWVVLEPAFMFPNRPYPYTIMGLDLGRDRRSPDGR